MEEEGYLDFISFQFTDSDFFSFLEDCNRVRWEGLCFYIFGSGIWLVQGREGRVEGFFFLILRFSYFYYFQVKLFRGIYQVRFYLQNIDNVFLFVFFFIDCIFESEYCGYGYLDSLVFFVEYCLGFGGDVGFLCREQRSLGQDELGSLVGWCYQCVYFRELEVIIVI